jgi:serine/threonine protein kinase
MTPAQLNMSCESSTRGLLLVQIVTGTTPSTRGKLQTPDTPQDCPEEVWALVQQCLMFKPEDRPSAKEVTHPASASGIRPAESVHPLHIEVHNGNFTGV